MKRIKGFTLLELIIVMAILAILMTAIMQLFKPIRETYVDSTLYESQRTAQNGMVRYITESVRFSTDMGMYTSNKSNSVTKAVEDFASVYLPAHGVQTTDSNYVTNLNEIKKYAEVIIIDNKTGYRFNNKDWNGRVLRRKFKYDASGIPQPLTANAEVAGTDECRLALGSAYYGNSDFSFIFDINQDPSTYEGTPDDGIKVTVSSQAANNMRKDAAGNFKTAITTNTGLVVCRNQCSPINGVFDTTKFDPAIVNSTVPNGTKVYIVYLNEPITILP